MRQRARASVQQYPQDDYDQSEFVAFDESTLPEEPEVDAPVYEEALVPERSPQPRRVARKAPVKQRVVRRAVPQYQESYEVEAEIEPELEAAPAQPRRRVAQTPQRIVQRRAQPVKRRVARPAAVQPAQVAYVEYDEEPQEPQHAYHPQIQQPQRVEQPQRYYTPRPVQPASSYQSAPHYAELPPQHAPNTRHFQALDVRPPLAQYGPQLPPPRTTRMSFLPMLRSTLLPAASLIVLISVGWLGWSFVGGSFAAGQKTTLAAVGAMVELPDEQPRIAAVTDPLSLPSNEIFRRAEKGDEVLMFQKSGLVVVFRPSTGKIVSMAPIELAGATSRPKTEEPPAVDNTATTTLTKKK